MIPAMGGRCFWSSIVRRGRQGAKRVKRKTHWKVS